MHGISGRRTSPPRGEIAGDDERRLSERRLRERRLCELRLCELRLCELRLCDGWPPVSSGQPFWPRAVSAPPSCADARRGWSLPSLAVYRSPSRSRVILVFRSFPVGTPVRRFERTAADLLDRSAPAATTAALSHPLGDLAGDANRASARSVVRDDVVVHVVRACNLAVGERAILESAMLIDDADRDSRKLRRLLSKASSFVTPGDSWLHPGIAARRPRSSRDCVPPGIGRGALEATRQRACDAASADAHP